MTTGRFDKYLDKIQYVFFAVFFLLLFMQFRLVGVQYDDYGYYSLNYGATTPHFGEEYTFAELFRFLGEHYSGANGRLLYFGIWLIIYKIDGLSAVQFAAALTVTVIWYLLWKVGLHAVEASSKYRALSAFVLCICYGSISIQLHSHGTYWFAAFFTYYMPIAVLILFVLYYEKVYKNFSWKHMLILMPLVFASAWSGENWSVGTVALMFVLAIRACWIKKKPDMKHLLLLLTAIIGLIILLKSPGILARAGNSQWGLADIGFYITRIKEVFSLFFSGMNMYYLLFFMSGCVVLAGVLFLKYRKWYDLLCAVGLVICELTVYIDCTLLHKGIAFVMVILLLAICRYYYYKSDNHRNMLLFAAFMAIASLAAVPGVVERLYISLEVCSFLIVFDACHELYQSAVKGKKLFAVVLSLYVIGMTGVAAFNSYKIYQGYKANDFINEENEAAMLFAKEQIEQGEKVSVIYLKKYPDDLYATITLYQEPWFAEYITRYYGLPDGIGLVYE